MTAVENGNLLASQMPSHTHRYSCLNTTCTADWFRLTRYLVGGLLPWRGVTWECGAGDARCDTGGPLPRGQVPDASPAVTFSGGLLED